MRAAGTTLEYSANGSSYTLIGSVRGFQPPTVTRGSAERTHLTSPSQAKEFIGSWIDAGTSSFRVIMAKALYNVLMHTILPAADNYYWRVKYPLQSGESTPSQLVWRGHISSLGVSELVPDDNDTVEAEVELKNSDFPQFTQGS